MNKIRLKLVNKIRLKLVKQNKVETSEQDVPIDSEIKTENTERKTENTERKDIIDNQVKEVAVSKSET